ncbi:glyoxalase [Neobacillus sp. PS3-12]|jgi:catechol 2,3-dioxygenase-like lactoylglutathione lyase family enzyme|uniref:VOC family protein n=1 Tax=Neobacillus sp. PS3-12 TaxID=3070677 RepID=UPI0027E142A1|nr:VOC family protein [Neobacillus sp. PS3-12]WML52799.1 glyoxalase [Neobacillus sp. PS3-12]
MSFVIKKIDHVQLAAPKGCEPKARDYFGEILGFQEIEKPEELKKRGGVWFEFAGFQIHIGVEENFTPAKKAHPAFEVQNLDGLKIKLIEKKVSYTEDNNLPGAKRIHTKDPFGNRLEFLEWE